MSVQEYEERFATFAMRQAPRMGYTNDFSMLASEDTNDQYEYTAGLIFLGAFMMVFFVMWGFGLFVCRWLGKEQVGFMSGWPMEKRNPKAKRLIQREQPNIIRSVFVCSALFWVIFTIVFLTVGLGAISDSQTAMVTGSNQVNSVLSTANDVSSSLQSMGEGAEPARDSLVKALQELCLNPIVPTSIDPSPDSASNSVTPELSNQSDTAASVEVTDEVSNQFTDLFSGLAAAATTTTTPSPTSVPTASPTTAPVAPTTTVTVFDGIESDVNATIDALLALNDFIDEELDDGEQAIDDAQEVAQRLFENANDESNGPSAAAIIFSIPWFIVPIALVTAVAMVWMGKSRPSVEKIMSKCVMPFFILMTMTSIILTTLLVSYAIGNADFCSGGDDGIPDESMTDILLERGVTSEQLLYTGVDYYVSQCQTSSPFVFLDTYKTELISASGALSTLLLAMTQDTNIETLVEVCGDQVKGIDSAISLMETDLEGLMSKVNEALALLECSSVVPIYTTLVYDTACNTTVHGLYWAYISFLIMSISGMTMITLRTAYLTGDGDAKAKRRRAADGSKDADTVADGSDSNEDSDADSDDDSEGDDSDNDDSDDGSDEDSEDEDSEDEDSEDEGSDSDDSDSS